MKACIRLDDINLSCEPWTLFPCLSEHRCLLLGKQEEL
jgi:hypothetical protein